MTTDTICPVCEEEEETLPHLFRNCMLVRDCWGRTLSSIKFKSKSISTIDIWVKENCNNDERLNGGSTWSNKFSNKLWGLWKARNDLVFNNTRKDTWDVADMATKHQVVGGSE